MQKKRNQLADSKKKKQKKKNALGSAMKILHKRNYKVLNAMLSIKNFPGTLAWPWSSASWGEATHKTRRTCDVDSMDTVH